MTSEMEKARRAYEAGQRQRKDVKIADDIARRDGAQVGGRQ
ncbi:hypothetical protein [Streptomyces eurythermus]